MMAAKTGPALAAKSSYREGHVAVGITLRASSWPGDRTRITASTDLTTEEARALAGSLMRLADAEDAKIAKRAASAERRKAWRRREIASGRMVMLEGRL